MIIAVIYATFAAAKRKPEKKKIIIIGRALHRYRGGQGFESRSSLNFFQAFFRNCKSCVYNCNDHPSINFNDGKVMLL